MANPSDATESILGFLFQGQYALLLLWEGEDDDAIALETDDDVVYEGDGEIVLSQLKHSRGAPPPLSVKNDGLWKAIRNWIRGAPPTDGPRLDGAPAQLARIYSFVTAADVADGSPLQAAVPGADRTAEGEAALTAALTEEAERVCAARSTAGQSGSPPYHDRAPGCEAWLALAPDDRARIVSNLQVLPKLFPITAVEGKVIKLLSASVPKQQRSAVAERLMEWWDRQVARALMDRRDRRIYKRELVAKINWLIHEHGPDALPDDFSFLEPTEEELEGGRGGIIERQIQLVGGGPSRTGIALVAWWRARGQRARWMDLDVSVADALDAFDQRLKEAWHQQHGPMCDDCAELPEGERCAHGLEILKWALLRAADEVVPPRPEWRHPFYAQGALQQLAEMLEVGWHPDFEERLRSVIATGEASPLLPKPRGRPRARTARRHAESK